MRPWPLGPLLDRLEEISATQSEMLRRLEELEGRHLDLLAEQRQMLALLYGAVQELSPQERSTDERL